MKTWLQYPLILGVVVAAGCGGSPGGPSGDSPASPDLSGNWQIESNAEPVTNPPNAIMLMGALENSGSQVTGTFRFTNLAQPSTCGLVQVVTLSGTIDSHNILSLTSAKLPNGTTIRISLGIGGPPPYSGTGTIQVDGATCAFAAAPALGEQLLSLTGTYTGTLTPQALGSSASGTSGTGTLALTQSNTPGTDGQFAVTGTLGYQFGSCSGSTALAGNVNGGLVNLSPADASAFGQGPSVVGFFDNSATKITTSLIFFPAPCSTDPLSNAAYLGALVKQ